MIINNFILDTLRMLTDESVLPFLIKLRSSARPVLRNYVCKNSPEYNLPMYLSYFDHGKVLDAIKQLSVEEFDEFLKKRHENSVNPIICCETVLIYNEAIKLDSPRKIMLLSQYNYDINCLYPMAGGCVGNLFVAGMENKKIDPRCFEALIDYGLDVEHGYFIKGSSPNFIPFAYHLINSNSIELMRILLDKKKNYYVPQPGTEQYNDIFNANYKSIEMIKLVIHHTPELATRYEELLDFCGF